MRASAVPAPVTRTAPPRAPDVLIAALTPANTVAAMGFATGFAAFARWVFSAAEKTAAGSLCTRCFSESVFVLWA